MRISLNKLFKNTLTLQWDDVVSLKCKTIAIDTQEKNERSGNEQINTAKRLTDIDITGAWTLEETILLYRYTAIQQRRPLHHESKITFANAVTCCRYFFPGTTKVN